jgi:hypothetical protein
MGVGRNWPCFAIHIREAGQCYLLLDTRATDDGEICVDCSDFISRTLPPLVAIPALGVQSRSEVGWVVSESPGLVCPSFAEVLVGGEPPQGLAAFSEVVGVEEGFEVFSELRVGLVVIAPNGGFLEGAVHPLDLTVGPGMVRLGEAVLDTMLAADAVEHVQPVAGRRAGTP